MENAWSRVANAIEVLVVLALSQYSAKLAIAAASLAGVTLPDMPVLRHTYLGFVFILILLLWVKLRGDTFASFGLIPFKARYLFFGLALAVGAIVLDSAVRSVSTPLIVSWTGADPHLDAKTFAEVKGNVALFAMLLPSIWLFAAFGEEVLYRGYLLTRFTQIIGEGRSAVALAIGGQAFLFGLAHAYQGPVGMVPIAIGAILSGTVSVAWGRNLWVVMITHGLVDTLGFTMLYLGIPLS
ncbi:MAG: CPBP family intramembrane metalloprotease [Alphaproteobacteria bacterium]|nr:CPBP family intramembrane metalloprotease [Alphaproteobacteria bacterium]